MHSRSLILAVLSFLLLRALPAFGQVAVDPTLRIDLVLGGLEQPSALAFYGPGDFLVLEKDNGRVINVVDGVRQPGWALDLAVQSGPERGLLGIAIHPDFPAVPRVYLYYTPSATGADTSNGTPLPTRIERYTFANGTLSSPLPVLTLAAPPEPQAHLGGPMVFGPDRKLYVITGDHLQQGGLQNNPPLSVADDTSVIFRLNDDGSAAPGNPLSAPGLNLSRYYAYGIRNSYGIAFDPVTGVLWETENGPDGYDELNRVAPGFNSGWTVLMGPDSRDPDGTSQLTAITGGQYSDPEFSWQNTSVPTGMAFLRGSALGSTYDDSLVVGSYGGNIYRFRINASGTAIIPPNAGLADLVDDPGDDASGLDFASGFFGVTDLDVGPDGNLYVVAILNGAVFVVRSTAPPIDTDGDGWPDWQDNCPTVSNADQADGGIGPLFESPPDGVGNACDNCVNAINARLAATYVISNPWATLTGDQRDDDHDGYGNVCDGDFNQSFSTTAADSAQFKASIGALKAADTCGTAGDRPCAIFDINATNATESSAGGISAADTVRYRQLIGGAPGPRCALCTGTGSLLLPCTAGTAGSCF
ncbi:MAG: PQQ-dependent sugar dehydrogenase [Myxococcota bacterium]